MNRSISKSNGKAKFIIKSQGIYNPIDPNDPYNIQRENQLYQSACKQKHEFKYINKDKQKQMKDNYFSIHDSNKKSQEKEIQKNREKRSITEINKFSGQKQIVQGNLNQPLPTKTQSRSSSTQNRNIIIKEIKNNYYDQQTQFNLPTQEQIGSIQLKLFSLPLTQLQEKQQVNQEILKITNQGLSLTDRQEKQQSLAGRQEKQEVNQQILKLTNQSLSLTDRQKQQSFTERQEKQQVNYQIQKITNQGLSLTDRQEQQQSFTDRQEKQQVNQEILKITNQGQSLTERQEKQQVKSPQIQIKSIQVYNKSLIQSQTQQKQSQVKLQQYQQLIEQHNRYQSKLQSMIYQCFHCNITQNSDFIFLPCSHQYHAECLKYLMNQQVNEQTTIIKCKCHKQIPQNICAKYLREEMLQIYYKLQVNFLPRFNQQFNWNKCSNQECGYLFIEIPSLRLERVKKCLYCQQKFVGKAISLQNI